MYYVVYYDESFSFDFKVSKVFHTLSEACKYRKSISPDREPFIVKRLNERGYLSV